MQRRDQILHATAFVLAAALLAVWGGISQGAAAAPEAVKMAFPVRFDYSTMPADVALDLGLWKKEGLDVSRVFFNGGSDQMRAVAVKSVSVGVTSPVSMFNAAARGVPVKFVGETITAPAGWGLAVLPDSPIRSLQQLKGKSIGMSRPGSLTNWAAIQFVKAAGLNVDAATYVPAGKPEAELASLRSRQVDAAVLEGSVLASAVNRKEVRVVEYLSKIVHVVYNGWFATDEFISRHPDTLRKLMKGWYQASLYMKQHRAYTVGMLMKVFKLDRGTAEEIYKDNIPYTSTDGALNIAGLRGALQSLIELGMQKTVPPLSTLIDRSFVPVRVQ